MHITLRSGEVFGLAGLWDQWTGSGGATITSVTIITTEPNELMAEIHNRMPVILQPDCVARWLSPEAVSAEQLTACLMPFPDSQMEMLAVSTLVNKPGIDRPECVLPVSSLSL